MQQRRGSIIDATIEEFFRDLAILKEYVGQAVNDKRPLTDRQTKDKTGRLSRLFDIGRHFDMTDKEITVLLFRGIGKGPA